MANSCNQMQALKRTSHLVCVAAFLVAIAASGAQAQERNDVNWTVRQVSDAREEANLPAIAADQAGGIHVIWPSKREGDTTEALIYGRYDGSGWSTNDVIAENVSEPRIAVDNSNTLHVLWSGGRGGVKSDLRYSSAPIGAATSARAWSEPVSLAGGPAFQPELLIDSEGILHASYSYFGDPSAIVYLRSTDGGLSWDSRTIFQATNLFMAPTTPEMAVGKDGTLHLVWSLIPAPALYGGIGVYYARSTDSGLTWTEPLRLDETSPDSLGEGAWQASVAAVGDKEVHVVWDAHSQTGSRRHKLSRDGGVTWSENHRIWDNFVYQTGTNPLTVDPSGKLYLFSAGAFDWTKRQGIYFSNWSGFDWTPPQLVDLSSEGPHWLQSAVSEGNMLHVVWIGLEQKPKGVWYASGRTTSPYQGSQANSGVRLQSTNRQSRSAATETLATASPTGLPAPTGTKAGSGETLRASRYPVKLGGPQDVAASGILPVVFLIGAVVLFQALRSRRR